MFQFIFSLFLGFFIDIGLSVAYKLKIVPSLGETNSTASGAFLYGWESGPGVRAENLFFVIAAAFPNTVKGVRALSFPER